MAKIDFGGYPIDVVVAALNAASTSYAQASAVAAEVRGEQIAELAAVILRKLREHLAD